MNKKVICVWIGTFESQNKFYQDYLNVDYKNEDKPESEFGKDAGLDHYDEDFMESWWFDTLKLNELAKYKDDLPDAAYFFDELIRALENRDLTDRNFISFLFGAKGAHSTNEILFKYNGRNIHNKTIEFIFKKEYYI